MTAAAPTGRPITCIAAYAKSSRAIGDHGRIPWHSSEDFAHFRTETMGQILVMGRVTWDSIGRPLPGRRTVVITRNPDWSAQGAEVVHSLDEALALVADDKREVFIAGGAQIYAQALPLATRQILTEVDVDVEGDAHYPEFDAGEWREVRREQRSDLDPALIWTWWERV